MTTDVTVACSCVGTPHTEDHVLLRPTVSTPMGVAAMAVIRIARTQEDMEAGLAGVFIRHGIIGWTFVGPPEADGRRQPVPVTPETIDVFLPWPESLKVAEAGDGLYAEAVMRPLVLKMSGPSAAGPTEALTSPTPAAGSTPPTRSRRSSRTSSAAGTLSVVPAR